MCPDGERSELFTGPGMVVGGLGLRKDGTDEQTVPRLHRSRWRTADGHKRHASDLSNFERDRTFLKVRTIFALEILLAFLYRTLSKWESGMSDCACSNITCSRIFIQPTHLLLKAR